MRESLKIIHAADLHLDSPFEALGEKAALRRREQRELLFAIAELAREKKADMVLLAGDLLDSSSAYAETFEALSAAFGSLECPVFIAPGNHDCLRPGSPYLRADIPENIRVFRGEWECAELEEKGARIYGAGFADIICPPLLRSFHAEREEGIVNIGLLHGDLGAAESRYCPITAEEVAASGLDYLALGHQHTYSGLIRCGDTVCAYPGCSEGRGFDECGEKGVLFLEVAEGSVKGEFIPIARRRYEIMELDISEGIPQCPAGRENDIVRIIFRGESDSAPDLGAIEREWEGNFFSLQLRDRSTLRRELWEGSSQDSLRGLFLRKMREKYENAPNEREKQKIIQALRWGLAALEGGEAVKEI